MRMINFSHVYKTYPNDTHALKNISLEIEKGEFIFLTGPSGAGKTTFFKLLAALDKPSSGEIIIDGFNLEKLSNQQIPLFRRKIGVVFQDFKLLNDRTILDNVSIPLFIKGGETAINIKRRVLDILSEVGLYHKADEFPETLSGGEKQRVAIARALVHRPGILIADEPTGNLDPALSEEIMDLFQRASAQGTTVVIATHDHELVYRRNKRTFQIKNGMIREGFL